MDKNQGPPPYNPNIYPSLNQPPPAGFMPPNYPPEQGGYQQTIIIDKAKFGPFPVRTDCPICRREVLTETYSSSGLLAWLLGGGLCLIGCFWGCCLIPCCVDACRDVIHRCPSCKQQIALFKRL